MSGDNSGDQIRSAAALLFPAGSVTEIRVPKAGRQKTISGYFLDMELMAAAVEGLERAKHPGVYWTLNPVTPALLARADHKVKSFAEATTSDRDIVRRCWLPVDLDPVRPAGISSSSEEHAAALSLGERIRATLLQEGWPEPLFADSGNGAHLLYPITLPNDPVSADLLSSVLRALAKRFDDEAVTVDQTTFNASRIFKIYGTTARKGDSTSDRPHRMSRIIDVPALLGPVPDDQLRAMAASAPVDPKLRRQAARPVSFGGNHNRFDVDRFLDKHGIRYRPPVAYEGGRKFVLDVCPWNPAHAAPDSAVFERADGSLGFRCLHNSCTGYSWKEFREFFEGPRRPASSKTEARTETPSEPRDGRDEIPLSAADVEAAIDEAIAKGSLEDAIRLLPEIARQNIQCQVLVAAKLRLKFGRKFQSRDFSAALRQLREAGAQPPPGDDDDPPADPGGPDLLGYPLTDSGNGERIVAMHGADLRFCHEFKNWLVWDGRRWKVDDSGAATQRAKGMARLLYLQASLVQELGLQKAIKEHARASESHAAITAALKRAASEPGMTIAAAELDQHRYLLNCMNGVVDVRTGELMPPDRKYLITKLCHVKYVPNAPCMRFLKFLNWTMGETTDGEISERVARLVGFLQKAFGYALTGDVSEKAAFIFYGRTGNNGKTTLLTIFTSILSEYATQLDINTLMASKLTDNNMRADMAKLHGARLVISSEIDDQQKLSERLLKYLTAGMGKVVACRKFENPIEFDATHKIFIDANHRPQVRGSDEAIWARLHCVTFNQHLEVGDPEIDKKLKDKILAESEGVLAWAVRGAMRWAKEGGLGTPPEVKEANADWRESDDPLREFVEDCCELGDPGEGYWVLASSVSAAYAQWCKENNEKYGLGRGQLKERLALKGFKYNRSRRDTNGMQLRTWEGFRIAQRVTSGAMAGSAAWRDDVDVTSER